MGLLLKELLLYIYSHPCTPYHINVMDYIIMTVYRISQSESVRRYIIFKFGGIIFVPSAKKWVGLFVLGDSWANIDKI